jgi:hypothetical protein
VVVHAQFLKIVEKFMMNVAKIPTSFWSKNAKVRHLGDANNSPVNVTDGHCVLVRLTKLLRKSL